jgi:ABC-type multidrug transport system fused ATPase/permease subunit
VIGIWHPLLTHNPVMTRMLIARCSIDGLNTSTIGLLDLRRRLAIIPQDAALFEGTIRDNLDPRHVHDDTELWSVLDHARLKEYVSGLPGQLDATIHEAGEWTRL